MSSPVHYLLDPDDAIESVGEGWAAFAGQNGAPELSEENVVGRRLVEFISSGVVQRQWLALLARVRSSGRRLTVPFRCDSPDLRRYMELELLPLPRGRVEHRAHLRRTLARDFVPLLHPALPRSDTLLPICSQCKRIEDPAAGWIEVDEPLVRRRLAPEPKPPRLIHGLCDPCHESLDRLARA